MEYPYSLPQVRIVSNSFSAKYTLLFFRVMMIFTLLNLALNVSILKTIHGNQEVLKTISVVYEIFKLIVFFPHYLLIIFFLLWMHRAYWNLHQSGMKNLKFRKGWAVSSWFVPFINLVRPLIIMEEIWNKTQEAFRIAKPFEKKRSAIVSYWWFTYVFSGSMAIIVWQMIVKQNWETAYAFAIIYNVTTLAALIVGARMVRIISTFEEGMIERAEEIQTAQIGSVNHNHTIEPLHSYQNAEDKSTEPEDDSVKECELTETFTDNSTRAKLVMIGLVIMLLLALAFAGICFYSLSLVKADNLREQFHEAVIWLDRIIMVGFFTFVTTGVFVLLWICRAYTNLHNLNIKGLSFQVGAASYSWFIPFGNLFIPYIILHDINRYLQEAISNRKLTPDKRPADHALVLSCWLIFLLSFFLLFRFFSTQNGVGYNFENMVYGILAGITAMSAFYLGAIVIKNISKLETQLYDKLEIVYKAEEINESEFKEVADSPN